MSFLQPRSVLQLVIVGFLVVVAPLCLAILYTVQTLGTLSEGSRVVTTQVIALNRHGQELQRDLLDLERRARQYLALRNLDLLALFNNEKESVSINIKELGVIYNNLDEVVSRLHNKISDLNPEAVDPGAMDQLIQQFEAITQARAEFGNELRAEVDRRITDQATDADKVKDSLLVMVFVMALATLMLMLFFSYWINRPIKMIANEIKLLGEGDLSRAIKISGPQEVKLLGHELEWLRGRLDDIDQQKQKFLRHVSHELKTPLANLREGADLLADEVPGPLSDRQGEIVSIVQHNSIELQRLIENLLDYNQLPHQGIFPEAIELDVLVASLLRNYHISVESKVLNVSHHWSVTEWFADRNKLKIALDNVISNAVNYTPENGSIVLEAREEKGKLIIDIANSGMAIQEHEEAHLFEPFYQGSSVRHGPIKGSGLGLSVAQECMQAQGGSLALEKHLSLAVCFRLICPSLEH
ncbi:MAG: HAMP domain-containing sensor histidine kinase [Porticoccus sp.]|nr:HAMP domain-containing sensor histidine kinase [Porticoccus sp.]